MTPRNVSRRLIATFVMLACLTSVIAAITSTSTARSQRKLQLQEARDELDDPTARRLDDPDARLGRGEQSLQRLTGA